MTTVEISRDALSHLKKVRDMVHERHKVQMRMVDLMEHIIFSVEAEDMVKMVVESINKGNNNKE